MAINTIQLTSDGMKLVLDIEHILNKAKKILESWVAPVTMAFENVYGLNLDIESQQGDLEVSDFHTESPRKTENGQQIEYTPALRMPGRRSGLRRNRS